MKDIKVENAIDFYELKWDTDYFGVKCAKAILNKPMILAKWNDLMNNFEAYNLISIENRNSEPRNTQLISRDTKAFLADVNIQFNKKLIGPYDMPKNISIHKALEQNELIVKIAKFQYSKFIEDPELAKRGGNKVYEQWLMNSFGKPDKYFALARNQNGEITGFLLHSYSENVCIIELIAVSEKDTSAGIGTNLFRAVEHAAYERHCNEIRVGTQARNIRAINFYNKVGCKQVGCHQVYHLWNL